MFDFLGCTIEVPAEHMSAIVQVESSAQQYAVGIVGHSLSRQPQSKTEALELIGILREGGYNFSVGLAQVNKTNFAAYGLTDENMFEPCKNIVTGSKILKACYESYGDWDKAYSCYYSGNPSTGFTHGYVRKINNKISNPILTSIANPKTSDQPIRIIPRKSTQGGVAPQVSPAKKPTLFERRLASSLVSVTSRKK